MPRALYLALVALLVAVAVGQGLALVLQEQVLPLYDGHYPRAVNLHRFTQTLDPTFLQRHGEPVFSDRIGLPDHYPRYGAYPPLVYLLTALAFELGGVGVPTARVVVVLFGLLLLPALAGIGRQLGGRTGGLAVLALAIASPVPLYASRMYLLDYPQTATTALALWALLASDGLRRRGPSIALGCLLALAMLTKWSAGYYLLVPLSWAALRTPGRQPRAWRLWGLGALLVAWVTAAVWLSSRLCTRPDQWVGQGWWLWAWALGILLPSGLAVGLLLRAERRWRQEPGWRESPAFRVANLLLAGATCLVLVGPWYAWVLGDLRYNLLVNTRHFASPGLPQTVALAGWYLARALPLGLLLLPLGVAWGLRDRQARPALLLAASGLIVLVLLLHTGDPSNFLHLDIQNRLSTGLVLFTAPVAGAWMGRAGRAGRVLTAATVALALFLVTGWLHSPGATAAWRPLFGPAAEAFFSPRGPPQAEREVAAPAELIALLERLPHPGRPWSHGYLIASRTLPVEVDPNDLYARALVEADLILAFDRLSPGVDQLDYRPMLAQQADRLAELHYLVLLASPGQDAGRRLLAQVQAAGQPQARLVESARIGADLEAHVVVLRP